MKVNPSVFKTNDIRGKYPQDVSEEFAELLGRAVADFVAGKKSRKNLKVLICGDVRSSSPALREAVARGLIKQGVSVLDMGAGTTPYFYFLIHKLTIAGGIMVTASHNPKEYNGFKIRGKNNSSIDGDNGLPEIKKLVLSRKFQKISFPGEIAQAPDHREVYLKFISQGVSISKDIKIVVDAAGGSTSLFLPALLNRFPNIQYKPLFFQPDGGFAKHSPNPLLPESQKFVQDELKKGKYNFGVVFDCDGDRVVFFDEKGNTLKSEFVFCLLVDEELRRHKGATFVMPVNISKGAREYIQGRGGKLDLTKIGYTFLQKAMKNKKARLGVELSGHFYTKLGSTISDSALAAFLRLASAIVRAGKPLSQLMKPVDTYLSSGERNFHVSDKEAVLKKIKKYFSDGKISEKDGVLIEYPDWWVIVRASNTEPVLRLVMEAKFQKVFDEKLKEVIEQIGGREE